MTTPTSVMSAPTVVIPEVSWLPGGTSSEKLEEEEEEGEESVAIKEEPTVSDVDKVTTQQLKLAQQKLAMLQKHSFSPLYKPTDIVSCII